MAHAWMCCCAAAVCTVLLLLCAWLSMCVGLSPLLRSYGRAYWRGREDQELP